MAALDTDGAQQRHLLHLLPAAPGVLPNRRHHIRDSIEIDCLGRVLLQTCEFKQA